MTLRYLNPVHKGSSADPFVLKHKGEYWCYSTGLSKTGSCFPVFHSFDLVNWREMNGAMEPLPHGWTEYWAPEVTYDNGRFLMYYSVGDGVQMQIRVAIAHNPAGPFEDSGHRLTTEEFAIDAHVFQDDDGTRYLFYATDFLSHSHVGTGTVCDQMLDAFSLAGDPWPVTLACYDWHVFDPQRAEKGGVRWHTVEGPFVLKHKGLYYQMFSAGNWQNITYGVSYAIADKIVQTEWRQVADGERVLPILHTIPSKVIGPGHNSVVRGPDNLQLFCVYHRWSENRHVRELAIDRLDWVGDRLIALGPSTTPQPVPIHPTKTFVPNDEPSDHENGWKYISGKWSADGREIRQVSKEAFAEARLETGSPYFVLEVTCRALHCESDRGTLGVELRDGEGVVLRFLILCSPPRALLTWRSIKGWVEQEINLPGEFAATADHLIRVECNGSVIKVALDGIAIQGPVLLQGSVNSTSLVTEGVTAAFSGFAITIGWQDIFTDEVEPSVLGWDWNDGGDWKVWDGELRALAPGGVTSIFKGPLLKSYELVVNCRMEKRAGNTGQYVIYPSSSDGTGPLLAIRRSPEGWCVSGESAVEMMMVTLPDGFDPFVSQQFRMRKVDGVITVWWESVLLGSIKISDRASRIGLRVDNAEVGFDLVRVTAISDRG